VEAAAWKKTEGMPSSHATNLTYYAVQIALNYSVSSMQGVSSLLAWAVLLLWRVRHKYHTGEQVAAGIVLGVILTFLWNAFVDRTNLNANLDAILLMAKEKTPF
jgi:acid phosphatase family membrane protein YuiD